MFLLGIVWSALAPALLVPVVWGAAHLLRVLGVPERLSSLRNFHFRKLLAVLVVICPVAGLYLQDRAAFEDVCKANSRYMVLPLTEAVDGMFLDDGTANSFGMRYLESEGFTWMESPSIYNRTAFTRYERSSDGKITSFETDKITAAHSISAEFVSLPGDVSLQRMRVSERATGKVLGEAASARFGGGRAKLFLGAYGSASCPNPATEEGYKSFLAFYHLGRDVLRPGKWSKP